MIEVLKDWDIFLRKHPTAPYPRDLYEAWKERPPEARGSSFVEMYIEEFKKSHEGTFEGKCSICGVIFTGRKPPSKCPFERFHTRAKADIESSARRMLK